MMTPNDIERAWKAAQKLAADVQQLVGDATPNTTLYDDLNIAQQRLDRAAKRLERAAIELQIDTKDAEIARDTAIRAELAALLSAKPQA